MSVYMNKYDTSLKVTRTAGILGNIAQLHTQTNEVNFKHLLQTFCKHQDVIMFKPDKYNKQMFSQNMLSYLIS